MDEVRLNEDGDSATGVGGVKKSKDDDDDNDDESDVSDEDGDTLAPMDVPFIPIEQKSLKHVAKEPKPKHSRHKSENKQQKDKKKVTEEKVHLAKEEHKQEYKLAKPKKVRGPKLKLKKKASKQEKHEHKGHHKHHDHDHKAKGKSTYNNSIQNIWFEYALEVDYNSHRGRQQ